MNKKIYLSMGADMGPSSAREYELVEFDPTDHPEQEGCYLLKPVDQKLDFKKMTKAQLIEYIEVEL